MAAGTTGCGDGLGGGDPLGRLCGRPDLCGLGRVGDDHCGLAGASGEVPAEGFLGGDGGGVLDEDLVQGSALGGQCRRERGQDQHEQRRRHPDAARCPVDDGGDAAPEPVAFRSGVGRSGRGGPERGASEEDQDGGQERQGGQDRADDADRADRAQGPVVGQVAGQQGEQAQGHGGGAGRDGAGRAAYGGGGCGHTVSASGEFFPEPGGQQQGVVGRGADDQDGQDALDLAVDPHDAPVGQGVDDRAGQAEGEYGADDDHEGQQEAAVDQQKNHQDRAERDAQQEPVDAGERVREVGLCGRRPRDLHGQSRHGRGQGAYLVQDGRQVVTEVGSQGHDGLQGLSVVRTQSR